MRTVTANDRSIGVNGKDGSSVRHVRGAARLHQIPSDALARTVRHSSRSVHLSLNQHIARPFRHHQHISGPHRYVARGICPTADIRRELNRNATGRWTGGQVVERVLCHWTKAGFRREFLVRVGRTRSRQLQILLLFPESPNQLAIRSLFQHLNLRPHQHCTVRISPWTEAAPARVSTELSLSPGRIP